MNSNKHDGLAVLAVFIKIGSKNHTLQKIIDKFSFIKLKGQKYKFDYIADIIDVKQLLPSNCLVCFI
jgi:carbonic anhydrase